MDGDARLNIVRVIHETERQSVARRRAVKAQWERIKHWNSKLPSDLAGLNVYCEGLSVASSKAELLQHIEHHSKGACLENAIWDLLCRGAEIQATEDQFQYECHGYLLDLKRLVEELPRSDLKERIVSALEVGFTHVLEARDRSVARRIGRTLKAGEVGILYVGADHEVEKSLPKRIKVETWCVF